MNRFKLPHLTSIRQKLILIILAVTILSIITGLTLEMINNVRLSRQDLRDNLTLDANLNADYLIPTYLFDDKKGAHDILQKLKNIPDIIYGAAFTPDGTLYADYKREDLPANVELKSFETNPDYVLVTQNVKSGNEVLGHLTLIASTDVIHKKTREHLWVVLVILLISIIIAIVLAYILERIVSGPVRELADVTLHIHDSLDYSIRVRKSGNDEIGMLYDGFNRMLESIENRRKERDIAEARLEEERNSLELRVNERTKELKLAKEKAEEADNLKSSFLANMSHEIRTPLNAILGCSSLIRDTSPSPAELDEYYRMMESSGKDLLKLIDDILDISRIEANQVKIEPQLISVNKICEEVFNTFKQLLAAEKPDNSVAPLFTKPFGEDEYRMFADPLRLKQIILNILNNSIKFTHHGSIELSFFPDKFHKNINIIVKDTGIGIAKDQQKRIFERFTKVADIKDKHYRGTGLGLSIALKLTQLLNGDIKVESELNLGTTFYLSFPLTDVKAPKIKSVTQEKEESLSFLSGKKILIAEDVEYNFRLLEILLNKNKEVIVLWARDGNETVSMVRENEGIDLILMDIQLPELNGLEATRIIKSEKPEIPVIAITAYAMPGDEKKVKTAGCDAYMIKPINNILLIHNLSKFLAGK